MGEELMSAHKDSQENRKGLIFQAKCTRFHCMISGALVILLIVFFLAIQSNVGKFTGLNEQIQGLNNTIRSLQDHAAQLTKQNDSLSKQIHEEYAVSDLELTGGQKAQPDPAGGWDVAYTLTNTSTRPIYHVDCKFAIKTGFNIIAVADQETSEVDPGKPLQCTFHIFNNTSLNPDPNSTEALSDVVSATFTHG